MHAVTLAIAFAKAYMLKLAKSISLLGCGQVASLIRLRCRSYMQYIDVVMTRT